jgi:RHS repeat-associated protein
VAYDTSSGTWVTQRYYPWGTIRPGGGNVLPTDYTFTGQKLDESTGLMYYGARYYDPVLGRFVQADSLVQTDARNPAPYLPLTVSYADPQILEQWNQLQRSRLQLETQARNTPSALDPQFLNRYAYARNNPLAYVDDSGYIAWWIVGGVVGGVVGFAAYAITHRENFDWREAALWTAGGAVVGGTLGAGAQWVAGALGTKAIATAGGAAAAQQIATRGGAEPVRIGQAGVQHVVNLLQRAGEPIIRQSAYFRTSLGRAFVDLETQNFLIEVKNLANPTMSQIFEMQARKYWQISQQIGKPLVYYFTNQPPSESMIQFLEELRIMWFHTPIP